MSVGHEFCEERIVGVNPLTIELVQSPSSNQKFDDGQRSCIARNNNSCILNVPRWTLAMFYFRQRWRYLLSGKSGIDIGARTGTKVRPHLHTCLGIFPDDPLLEEMNTPHYRYYMESGSSMEAIDIGACVHSHRKTKQGDIRRIPFLEAVFDFATVAMILGTGNPLSSWKDIMLAVSEIKRVLRPGGIAYLADTGFSPTVSIASELVGLEVYASVANHVGLPIGTFLRRSGERYTTMRLQEILVPSNVYRVCLPANERIIVSGCNLLLDAGPPHVLRRSEVILGNRTQSSRGGCDAL